MEALYGLYGLYAMYHNTVEFGKGYELKDMTTPEREMNPFPGFKARRSMKKQKREETCFVLKNVEGTPINILFYSYCRYWVRRNLKAASNVR